MADATSYAEGRQADFDTGGGTDLVEVSGIFVPASGGGQVVGGLLETGSGAFAGIGVGGATPHDSVDSGNPVKIGGHAYSGAPTAVSAANDRTDAAFTLRGALHSFLVDSSGVAIPTGTQYAEDGALGSNGTGTLMIARRDDALSTLTPVADDAVGLRVGDKGALWVQISDGSGNQITSFGGGTQYVGDAAATSTPTGTMMMGLANASAPTAVSANNDAVAAWLDPSGAQMVGIGPGYGRAPAQQSTSSPTALAALDIAGAETVGVRVGGTYTGLSCVLQVSMDGTNWTQPNATLISANGPWTSNGNWFVSTASNGTLLFAVAGWRQVRVNVTAIASGTVTFDWNLSVGRPTVGMVSLMMNAVNSSTGMPAHGASPGTINSSDSPKALIVANIPHYWDGTGSNYNRAHSARAITGINSWEQPAVAPTLYNGSTFDVWRSLEADAKITTTGIAAVGVALVNASGFYDRPRSVEALSTAPNVDTGIIAIGAGPGFDRKRNPSNLGTAANSAITNTVDGADVFLYYIGTATSGTYTLEVTADDTNWVAAKWVNATTGAISSGNLTPAVGDVWVVFVSGWRQVRIRTVTTLGVTVAVKTTSHLGFDVPGTWRSLTNARALDVSIVDGTGAQITSFGGGTQYAGDAAATSTPTGTMGMGLANAAAPSDVSANNDAVAMWMLRNGSQVVNLASGGTLVTVGQKAMASSLPVVLASDQSLVEIAGDVAQDVAIAGNPVQIGFRASTAVPTAMSGDGDIVYPWANRSGAPVVTQAPHVGLNSDPWALVHEGAQYTTTQTSTVFAAGGASEKIVVTKVQIQAFGTNAGDCIVYFGTGAFARGTNRAIFDGTFKPSATLAPGAIQDGPFISGTNGDDIMVTTTNNLSVTVNIWFYVVV